VHFVLAILLLTYLLLIGAFLFFATPRKREPRRNRILRPFPAVSGVAIGIFSLAVSIVDTWVWGEGTKRGYDLKPAPLGYVWVLRLE
jgi:hypothetical protein